MAFYIAIILFILSVISGLLAMVLTKEFTAAKFNLLASIHAILLLPLLAWLFLHSSNSNGINYFFLIFICSGIILSGLAWKGNAHVVLRSYFSCYILTIGMFILSPSMLVNFLLTMKYTDVSGDIFLVRENFYLEEQNNYNDKNSFPHYKLIRKRGFFHSTIQRDLLFNGKLDSIKVVDFDKSTKGLIRGYTSSKTFVSTEIDSTDIEIILTKKSTDGVEYHL